MRYQQIKSLIDIYNDLMIARRGKLEIKPVPKRIINSGKQLGAGHFGVVVEAKALGKIYDANDRKTRTVAVKMVKSSLDSNALKSLASELQNLILLGRHLNVIHLLGACTKNAIRGIAKYMLTKFLKINLIKYHQTLMKM